MPRPITSDSAEAQRFRALRARRRAGLVRVCGEDVPAEMAQRFREDVAALAERYRGQAEQEVPG